MAPASGETRVTERSRRGWSLATKVTALVALAVAASIVSVTLVSFGGVYDLASREDSTRLSTYRDFIIDDASARFTVADRVVTGLAATMRSNDVKGLSRSLAAAQVANGEYFEAFAVLGPDGRQVAAGGPEAAQTDLLAAAKPALDASSTRPSYRWDRAAGRLVVAEPLRNVEERGATLVGLVRVTFFQRLLDTVASETQSRSIYVLDSTGRVVMTGKSSASVASDPLVRTPDPLVPGHGSVTVDGGSLGRFTGYYADLTFPPDLRWQLVVVESEAMAMARARQALLPATIAMLAGAVLALVIALVFGRRLVAPLREFERRAREVASGGYVRPVAVDRADEVGMLAEAFNDMGVRLNSLQDMAQLLASANKLDEVLGAVLDAAGHLLGTRDAAVLLHDGDGRLVLASGRGLLDPGRTVSLPDDGSSPAAVAFRALQPVSFRGDDGDAAGLFEMFGADKGGVGVAVPLVVAGEALGVIIVLSAGRRLFTEAQVETLRAFSAHAAVAVQDSRLYEEEHVSRREAEALREVAELIAGPRPLAEALRRVAAIASALLGARTATFAVAERSSVGLEPSGDPELERAALALWRAVEPVGTGSGFEPVVVDDATPHPSVQLLTEGAGELLMVSLLRSGDGAGVMVLRRDPDAPTLTRRQIALAIAIAQAISLALENAFSLQQARTRAANLETVFRISQAVSSSLQINVVLNRVLDVVQKIFTADAVSLMAYDPAKRLITTSMARGVSSRDLLYLQVRPGEDIPGQVFDTRVPAGYDDLSGVDTPLARMSVSQGLLSMLAVPLLARGRSIGVLSVFDRSADAFSGEDLELLLTFASQAALAIDTAGLYGREHHVASVLQSSILPEQVPEVPGLETSSFYLPVGLEAEIGGDYYDLFRASDGRVVLAIGDVCGKGIIAATKTSMIKYTLRGMVAAGAEPADALSELNRVVSMTGDPSDIVTAWLGFLDLETGLLTYANGGHPPGLVRRSGTRRIDRLAATGPLLGAIADAAYGQRTVLMRPDDMLLLYTDGVTEARRGSRFFGEGRVRRMLKAAETADQAVGLLLEAVGVFTGGRMRDDAAVLALRRLRPADAADGAVSPPAAAGMRDADDDGDQEDT